MSICVSFSSFRCSDIIQCQFRRNAIFRLAFLCHAVHASINASTSIWFEMFVIIFDMIFSDCFRRSHIRKLINDNNHSEKHTNCIRSSYLFDKMRRWRIELNGIFILCGIRHLLSNSKSRRNMMKTEVASPMSHRVRWAVPIDNFNPNAEIVEMCSNVLRSDNYYSSSSISYTEYAFWYSNAIRSTLSSYIVSRTEHRHVIAGLI